MSASTRKKDDQEKQEQETEETQKQQRSSRSRGRSGQAQQAQSQGAGSSDDQQSGDRRVASRRQPRELEPTETFEPVSAARLATLRLARNWRMGGNVYGAMHAYERILAKYGGTPAAHAAAEELISMAGELEREGKFYTALNIFNKIEEYYSAWHGDHYEPRRPEYGRYRRA